MAKPVPRLSPDQIAAVIATAWDDSPPFNRTLLKHGIMPGPLVQLLKREMTPGAYKIWNARIKGKPAKPTRR